MTALARMHCVSRTLRVVTAWAAAVAIVPVFAQAQDAWRYTDVSRVVVFADVHGAYDELTELLRATGAVDANLAWIGGETHLVSVGDLLDRGADSRAVMDLLMRLQTEAADAGGRVHVVLGNHELMNLIGDLRYVSTGEYAAFAADESEAMRAAAYATLAGPGETPLLERDAFDRLYPPGYFAHRAAFAADGLYGNWLLSLPAIIVINETAYVHGGLPPPAASSSPQELTSGLQAKIRRYLELRDELAGRGVLPVVDMQRDWQLARAALEPADPALEPGDPALVPLLEEFTALADGPELGLDSPLWYRGSVYCKPMLEEPTLDAALAQLGAERVVVGHTPTADRRVRAIYGGKLVMLDTGMFTDYYNGRPSALLLAGGESQVLYVGPLEREALVPRDALVAYGLTDAELVAALGSGTPTGFVQAVDGAPLLGMIEHENVSIKALFYPDERGELELAAAALDGLLGTMLVPPTVSRTIDGTAGALQLVYPDAISESQRLERNLGLSGWCQIPPQLQLLYAFDVLTYNRGRSPSNVYYNNELSDLTVSDHGRAFGTERALPPGFDPGTLQIPEALVAALRALETKSLESATAGSLDSRQIRGLLARRDRLLADR